MIMPGVTLESLLRNPATAKPFTLFPCDRGWQCSVKRGGNSYNVTIDADPVKAVMLALIANRDP